MKFIILANFLFAQKEAFKLYLFHSGVLFVELKS